MTSNLMRQCLKILLIVIKSETLCRFSNTVCVRKRMNAQLPTTNNLKTFWSRGRVGKYVKLLFDRKMHSYEYIHVIRRCRISFVILEVYQNPLYEQNRSGHLAKISCESVLMCQKRFCLLEVNYYRLSWYQRETDKKFNLIEWHAYWQLRKP